MARRTIVLLIVGLLLQTPIAVAYDVEGAGYVSKERERFIIGNNVFYVSTVSTQTGDFLVPIYSDGTDIYDEELMSQLFEMRTALTVAQFITKRKLPVEITPEKLILILKELEAAGAITRGFSNLLERLDIYDYDLHLKEADSNIERGKAVTKSLLGITDLQHWAVEFQNKRDWNTCKNFEAALGRITVEALAVIVGAKAASTLIKSGKNAGYRKISKTVPLVLPPSLIEKTEVRQGTNFLKGLLGYVPFESIDEYVNSAERGLVLLLFKAKAKLELENTKKNLLAEPHYPEEERGIISRIFGLFTSLF
jgi:hypothetical protein